MLGPESPVSSPGAAEGTGKVCAGHRGDSDDSARRHTVAGSMGLAQRRRLETRERWSWTVGRRAAGRLPYPARCRCSQSCVISGSEANTPAHPPGAGGVHTRSRGVSSPSMLNFTG